MSKKNARRIARKQKQAADTKLYNTLHVLVNAPTSILGFKLQTSAWTDLEIAAYFYPSLPNSIGDTVQDLWTNLNGNLYHGIELVLVLNHIGWKYYSLGKTEEAHKFFQWQDFVRDALLEKWSGDEEAISTIFHALD